MALPIILVFMADSTISLKSVSTTKFIYYTFLLPIQFFLGNVGAGVSVISGSVCVGASVTLLSLLLEVQAEINTIPETNKVKNIILLFTYILHSISPEEDVP
jgi:hypothetical protein